VFEAEEPQKRMFGLTALGDVPSVQRNDDHVSVVTRYPGAGWPAAVTGRNVTCLVPATTGRDCETVVDCVPLETTAAGLDVLTAADVDGGVERWPALADVHALTAISIDAATRTGIMRIAGSFSGSGVGY
jgi:hypothetical protein